MKLTVRTPEGEYPHLEYVDKEFGTGELAKVIHQLLTDSVVRGATRAPPAPAAPVPFPGLAPGILVPPAVAAPAPAAPEAPVAPDPPRPTKQLECPVCGFVGKTQHGLDTHRTRKKHRGEPPGKPEAGGGPHRYVRKAVRAVQKLTVDTIRGAVDALVDRRDLEEYGKDHGVANQVLLRTITNEVVRQLGGEPRMLTQPLDPKAVKAWKQLSTEEADAIVMKALSAKRPA